MDGDIDEPHNYDDHYKFREEAPLLEVHVFLQLIINAVEYLLIQAEQLNLAGNVDAGGVGRGQGEADEGDELLEGRQLDELLEVVQPVLQIP